MMQSVYNNFIENSLRGLSHLSMDFYFLMMLQQLLIEYLFLNVTEYSTHMIIIDNVC